MTWTLTDIQDANELTAEDWASAQYGQGRWAGVSWLWVCLVQRLCWTFGEAGALDRLNAPLQVAA